MAPWHPLNYSDINSDLHSRVILSTAHKNWWHFLASFPMTSVSLTTTSAPHTISYACFPLLSAFLISYHVGSLSCCVSFLASTWEEWPFLYTPMYISWKIVFSSCWTINQSQLICYNLTFFGSFNSFKMLKPQSFFLFKRHTVFGLWIWHRSWCLNILW